MGTRVDGSKKPARSASNKQERFLTVTIYPEARPHVPWIRLRGKWLSDAGFTPRSQIRVRVMKDCLVITKESSDHD